MGTDYLQVILKDEKVLWVKPANLKRLLQLKSPNANHASTKTCQIPGCDTKPFNLSVLRVTKSGRHSCRACGITMCDRCTKQAKVYGYSTNPEKSKIKPVCKICYKLGIEADQKSDRRRLSALIERFQRE